MNRLLSSKFAEKVFFISCIFLNVTCSSTIAADTQSDKVIAEIDSKIQECSRKLDKLESSPELNITNNKATIGFLKSALEYLDRHKAAYEKSSELSGILNQKSSINELFNNFSFDTSSLIEQKAKSMSIADINKEITKLKDLVNQEKKNLNNHKAILEKLNVKPEKLNELKDNFRQEKVKTKSALDNLNNSKNSSNLINAEKFSLECKYDMLETELLAAEKESEIGGNKTEYLNTGLESNIIHRLEKVIKIWEKVKSEHEANVGYSELRKSEKILNDMNKSDYLKQCDFLINIAKRNIELAKNIIDLQRKQNSATTALSLLETRLAQNKENFDLTRRRVSMLGLTKKTSIMLQGRRASLQTDREDPGMAAKRQNEIVNCSLQNDDLIYEVQKYLTMQNQVFDKIAELGNNITDMQRKEITSQAYVLLDSYRKLLENCTRAYTDYINKLNKQQSTQKEIEKVSKEFRDYINQRLLWATSGDFFTLSDILTLHKAFFWLISGKNWIKVLVDFKNSVYQWMGFWLFMLFLFVLSIFILISGKVESYIQSLFKKDNVAFIFLGFVCVIIKKIMLPMVIFFSAGGIYDANEYYVFTSAFVESLRRCIATIAVGLIVLEFCKDGGIGRKLFNWSDITCSFLRKCVGIVFYILAPVIFICLIIQYSPQSMGYRASLGRFLFITAMIVICVFAVRNILEFKQKKKKKPGRKSQKSDKEKFYLWLSVFAVVIPIILGFMTILGYYFTALQLFKSAWEIICFITMLLIVNDILKYIIEIAAEKIQSRMQKDIEEIAKESNEQAVIESQGAVVDVLDVEQSVSVKDYEEMFLHMLKFSVSLIGVIGICLILSELFPALKLLDSYTVWNNKITSVDGQVRLDPVSLLEIIKALIIFGFTYVIVKNFSAVLEIVSIGKSKIHPGTKYAVELICQYFISGFGFFWGISFIGIGWGQFQYIAAAMTLGLSFGLQEIFANFVSGIILLFERPIRLGDSVNVGGCIGTVSKIRIRSTTVTTYDRHEIIIPNKLFLTEKITNWSLSDKVIRIIIDIGVAYGTDTAKVEKLLLNIAEKNKIVLKDPAPSVVFESFGADSLNFKLRVFTEISENIKLQNQLRHEINKRFKEENIAIPFAQRDIHLSADEGPLKIQVIKDNKPK